MGIPRDIRLKSESGQLILRPPVLADAEAIYQAVDVSRLALAPWMDWYTPEYSIDDTIEWLEMQPGSWAEGTNFQFALFNPQDEDCLGFCGINHINPFYLLANLGYWVRSDQTSKGIATRAVRLVAQFGFRSLKLRRIEIVTGEENWASRKVAENAGARFEGILRKRLKIGEGNIDAAMHSLIPEDFTG
jgi:RimJ/RimL family protein N-acetyltransferase